MLPRAHRLSRSTDIGRVFRMGRKAYEGLFSFSALPNSLGQTRIAVIATKKLFPRAVDRNRMKRLLRESLRPFLPRIAPGFDIAVLTMKKLADRPDIRIVSHDIESLLRKTGMLGK